MAVEYPLATQKAEYLFGERLTGPVQAARGVAPLRIRPLTGLAVSKCVLQQDNT